MGAIRLVLQYALGSPLAGTSPDRVEHEEWELRSSRPTMAEVAPVVMERPPLGIANAMGTGVDIKHWDDMRTGMARNSAHAERRAARRQEREAKRAEKRRRRAEGAGVPLANGGNGHAGTSHRRQTETGRRRRQQTERGAMAEAERREGP